MPRIPVPSNLSLSPADAQRRLADLLEQLERLHLTDLQQARQLGRQALVLARQLEQPGELAQCLMWQGIMWCHSGSYRRAFTPLKQALGFARQAQDALTEARIQNCLGIASSELGQYAHALEHHHENLRLVQEQGDLSGRLRALVNIGDLRSKLGDVDQGLAHQREALQIARQLRSKVEGLFAALNIMSDLVRLGRHAQALRCAERNLQVTRRLGFTNEQAQVYVCLSKSLLALGRPDEARRRALEGLDVVSAAPQGDLECELRIQLGRALARQGEGSAAIAQVTRAVEQAQLHGYRRLAASGHSELANLLYASDPATAFSHLAQARTLELDLHGEEARQRTQAMSAELAVERYRHQAELERVRREELTELNAQLSQTQTHLSHQAQHDALTGLANRPHFETRLRLALSAIRQPEDGLAVLFIDLDHFKRVNDTLGHDTGDQLLQEVAARLKTSVRAGDLVARLGGDEFTVLLGRVADPAAAERVARHLVTVLEQPFVLSGRELCIGASVGIALAPRDGLDPVSLQKHADTAMYRVKHAGRGAILSYTPAMGVLALRTLELEQNLRTALDRGEFELHFQPQYDVRSRSVLGVEALVRWKRGDDLIPPDEFIPIAERSGLIVPLGHWVLREACAAAVRWRVWHPNLRLAVNVSPIQFAQSRFAGSVAEVLRDTGLPPGALELELTEGTVMRNVQEAVHQLTLLRDLGVGIAIDDFGTGHSTLGLLRHLKVTTLKIDRSFVRDLAMPDASEGESHALVAAMMGLADGLKLNVVAEGVETEAQLEALSRLGCLEVQGFALSRPLRVEQVDALLTRTGAVSGMAP